jgi:hypothetical protein
LPAILENCSPTDRTIIADELCLVHATTANGISTQRHISNNNTWDLWTTFCQALHCDPELSNIDDPIPLLLIFAQRYRLGIIAPGGAAVHSRTVEGALRAVGQAFSTLGCHDPRLTSTGKLDFRLKWQLTAYSKQDLPPHHVKPIPFPIIAEAANLCRLANTPYTNTIADMLILGFYFLLPPGEYAATENPDATPFRLCDVHLLIHHHRLNPITATEYELHSITFVALEFTNQKNGVGVNSLA